MDIILRRCSPPPRQPVQRSRNNSVPAAATSSRPAEAALEPDPSPRSMALEGQGTKSEKNVEARGLRQRHTPSDAKQGNPGSAHEVAAVQLDQQQQRQQRQRRTADQENEAEGEVGPAGHDALGNLPLEWLLLHGDLRNVDRIQQELLLRQQQQQKARNGLGTGMEQKASAAAAQQLHPLLPPPADVQGPKHHQQQQPAPSSSPLPEQQHSSQRGGSEPMEGQSSGAAAAAPAPAPEWGKVATSPAPSKLVEPPQPQLLQKARATRTPSHPERRAATGAGLAGLQQQPLLPHQLPARSGANLQQQPQEAAGGAMAERPPAGGGGSTGGARARSAGRERVPGERAQGSVGGEGAIGLARRGRQSTGEDELLVAAGALELLANSGPGTGGGGAAGPAASASQGPQAGPAATGPGAAGIGGSRAGASSDTAVAAAAARGDPILPVRAGGGGGGRGPMGFGGGGGFIRRGGGGRGMRIGGTGPRIIRGTLPPDPDLDEEADDASGGEAARRARPTDSYGSMGRGGAAGSPSRGRGPRAGPGGSRYRSGTSQYDAPEDEDGAGIEGGHFNALYGGGGGGGDLPDDEAMFGPVPRRLRMSVFCAPRMYEELLAVSHPDDPIQMLVLSSGQLARMVERQRECEQQLLLLQRTQQRAALLQQLQQQHYAAAAGPQHKGLLPVITLGPAAAGYGAHAHTQDILRRALLLQQQQQLQRDGEWDDMQGDVRYGGSGATAPPLGRRAGGGDGRRRFVAARPPQLALAAEPGGGDWCDAPPEPRQRSDEVEESFEADLPPGPAHAQPPPYGRSYEEVPVAQQHQAPTTRLGGAGRAGRGVANGGGGEPAGGPQLPPLSLRHQQPLALQQQPHADPMQDGVPYDYVEEFLAGQNRRARPLKGRSQGPDIPPQPGNASNLADGGSGGSAKRPWSPLGGRGGGSGPYSVGGGGGSTGGGGGHPSQQLAIGYDSARPDAGLGEETPREEGGPQMRSVPDDNADVVVAQGRSSAGRQPGSSGGRGDRGDGGVGSGVGAAAATTGRQRQRPSGSLHPSARPSFSTGHDSGVEEVEVPPPTARAHGGTAAAGTATAGGGGGRGSGRAGSGAAGPCNNGRSSIWHGGSSIDEGGMDVGGGNEQYYRSYPYDRLEPSGGGGVAAAAAPSKRQRLATADGAAALPNGRGGGGRGRYAGPGGPGSVVLAARGGGGGRGAVALQRRQQQQQLDMQAYEPLVEVRDVVEEDAGRQLSVSFLHSTLGTFAGTLTLVTAE